MSTTVSPAVTAEPGPTRDIAFYLSCAILFNLICFIIFFYAQDNIAVIFEADERASVLFVIPYALIASLGLSWARMLKRWQSALFLIVVIGAHYLARYLAHWVAVATTGLNFGSLMSAGILGGLTGSLVCYLGIAAIKASWSASVLKTIAVFSLILALAGCGLLLAGILSANLFGTASKAVKNTTMAAIIYIPWQVIFSIGVVFVCDGRKTNLFRGFINWWSQ